MTHNTPSNKANATKLTKQAIGTLQKILEMIEQDKYCPDVIQQLDSVSGTLNKARLELLTGHLDHCLEHQLQEDKAKTVQELLKLYRLSK